MSYEGEKRVLCRNGHLHEGPCYMVDFDQQRWRCPDCGEPVCWHEAIDQTNDAGIQTHLKIYTQHRCTCPQCGNEHSGSEPAQYYIPEKPASAQPRSPLAPLAPLAPTAPCGYTVLETGEHFDTAAQAHGRHHELWEEREAAHEASLRDLGRHD